jgi:hypothetical protein
MAKKVSKVSRRPEVQSNEARPRLSQSDFPAATLQEAHRIAAALNEFGGQPTSPPDVAVAIESSPTSSVWRVLCGSSIGYGLTEGGHNAAVIALTPLGRRLVAPEQEGDDLAARREAILRPRLMREFYERYRRAKFPNDVIAANVLRSMGIPQDRIADAISILKANGRYAGIIRELPTGLFINLDSPGVPGPAVTARSDSAADEAEEGAVDFAPTPPSATITSTSHASTTPSPSTAPETMRVFITHGKQRAIVAQLKELLSFGQFEPVVSVERESTAIPVPEKVFEDMRSCQAGVIHVGAEGEYLDRDGKSHQKINDNVLIEIGAAMALYGKKTVLLVEKGVALPSNLQGLYRCDFEGDRLEYDATMKLLKTFSQFR